MKTTHRRLNHKVFVFAMKRAVHSAGPRYTPGLPNMAGSPNVPIRDLLTNMSGLERSESFWSDVREAANELENASLDNRKYLNDCRFVPGLLRRARYIETSRQRLLEVIDGEILSKSESLGKISLTTVRRLFGGLGKSLLGADRMIDTYEKRLREQEQLPHATKLQFDSLRSRLHRLRSCLAVAEGVVNGTGLSLANNPTALLLGDVGIGKTHFVCDYAARRLTTGSPTLIVLAKDLNQAEPDILKAVVAHLGVRSTKQRVLEYLAARARKLNSRAVIIVDGINEGDRAHWRTGTRSLLSDLSNYPEIGLVLTCRMPFERLYLPARCWSRFIGLRHPGFRNAEVEAHREFFSFYGIKPPDVPLLLAEYANPLFLKVVCKSLQNVRRQKHPQIRELASGQKGFTMLYEHYVRHSEREVTAAIRRKYPSCLLRKERWLWGSSGKHPGVIKEAAQLMVSRGQSFIEMHDLNEILARYLSGCRSLKPIRQMLLAEGVLIQGYRWEQDKPREVLEFPYQKVSDHLIVRTALSGVNTRNHEEVRQLVEDWEDEPNLIEALMVELPARTEGCEYFDFLETREVSDVTVQSFLSGLPWRVVDTFSCGTELLLEACLHWEQSRMHAYASLVAMSMNPEHPCGALFLDRFLSAMVMAERDHTWTEYLRHGERDSLPWRLLGWITTNDLSSLKELDCSNYIRLLKWFLTSTSHELRDLATKAIYLAGRVHPSILFREALESLKVNDPYVPERMLAASYGVAMDLYGNDPTHRGEFDRHVPRFSHELYKGMFAEGAPFATTHALRRDYALRTIQLALQSQPRLLGRQCRERLTPPFKDSEFKRWYRSGDRNESEYRDGNAPIGMDFEKYVLGPLATRRRTEDPEDPNVVSIRERILWRIYGLGYSLERFGETDRQIAQSRFSPRPSESDEYRVDRYGKKYSWIAYHELYGYLVDKGRIRPYTRRTRPDLDPSFCDGARSVEIVKHNLLGDSSRDLADWIRRARTPSLSDTLFRETVCEQQGPWVLLDAAIVQDDRAVRRRCSVFSHSFLISDHDYPEFLTCLKRWKAADQWFPEEPDGSETFVGEMPWCETVKHNGVRDWQFAIGRRRIVESADDLHYSRHGKKLSPEERAALDDKVLSTLLIRERDEQDSALLSLLDEEQIDIDLVTQDVERHETIYRTFEIELPVRKVGDSGVESCVCPRNSASVPSKEICERFGLRLALPYFDTLQPSGERATISTHWGEGWLDEQWSTYIRESMLRAYLRERGQRIVWLIHGERMPTSGMHAKIKSEYPGAKLLSRFTQVFVLTESGVERVR